MKALVAGAGGQLGRALQSTLVDRRPVALTHGQLDITKLNEVREAIASYRPEIVINAAAYNDVDGAEDDQEGAFRLNALGPRNLALATAERRIPLLHVSTDYVFDGMRNRPYHEFDEPNPLSVYGRSKLAGEQAVASLNERHYIVRTSWLYHVEPAAGSNFLKTMLALSSHREVRVVDDQHGSPTYAPHLAEAIVELIETSAYGVYHLAGSGGTNRFELTRRLYQLFGIDTPIRPMTTSQFPRPARRPLYSMLTSIQDPQILLPPWEQGLAAYAMKMKEMGQYRER